MTHDQKEEVYQERLAYEAGNLHPDGCFYCGAAHPSDTCRSPESAEWWRDEREAIR